MGRDPGMKLAGHEVLISDKHNPVVAVKPLQFPMDDNYDDLVLLFA